MGLEYRHVAGGDMLVQPNAPSARRAVHMVFAGERVRAAYLEAVPELAEPRLVRGLPLISIDGLVRMKLTSFWLKDQTHLKDMDEAGLITPNIEAGLPEVFRERLRQVREAD